MAYRKTEKVLAQIEAKRSAIIAATLDVIEKSGMEGLTTDAVADRGGFAVGLIYKYFPDKTELREAAIGQLLSRDLAAMRESDGLENGILVLISRMRAGRRLMSTIAAQASYREGIRFELARLIRAAGAAESPSLLAAAAFGAIFEGAGYIDRRDEATLLATILRLIGVRVKKASITAIA